MTKRTSAGREFRVDVAELRRNPGSRRHVVFDGEIPDLAVSNSLVPEGEPVHVDVVLESVSGGIMVTGTISTRWVGECRRCLEAAEGPVIAEVQELCEINPADEEATYRLADNELDLLPIAHDACILDLPLAPLCRPDCQGLCPTCGANRNLEACSCAPVGDGRFAALSDLLAQADELTES